MWPPAIAISALAAASVACSSSSGPDALPRSQCVAFAKPGEPKLEVDLVVATHRVSPIVSLISSRDTARMYALDRDGRFGSLEAPLSATLAANVVAVAVGGTGPAAYAARWARGASSTLTFQLVRFASPDDGYSFDAATEKVLFEVAGLRDVPEATSLAFGADGRLYVALGDAYPAAGGPPTMLGKILRVDVGKEPVTPEVWAVGVHEPRGLDVDVQGEVWLTDRTKDDSTVVHRITRSSAEPLVPVLYITTPERRPVAAGGHVYRGKLAPSLVGQYVYPAQNGKLVAVARFGPSGPAQGSLFDLGTSGPIGRRETGELAIAANTGVGIVIDTTPRAMPTSLLATQCFDLLAPSGAPGGAIPYDVTTPLWSDGAAKERFVFVPPDARLSARADGRLVFPVGTVAVKTFAVDGKRIETRLLVQHDVEDWVGYSYAWNAAGTDADLVVGDRTVGLPGGKSWYFPSTADCTACHTPAAGYTLGLEAKQLATRGDALARLEAKLPSPIDRAPLVPLVAVDAPPPATAESRARSYLHANCSICHRDGSATGTTAELDLRNDTPLPATGLCREPQVDPLGIANARIVAPGDPSRSVLVARMRSLDERRMPKLASRVVDQAGVAAVEAWIRDLKSCP